ncbi:MAG: carbohydrate ABC transporter permease [Treponema sp.]|nr:carbohydrate ABC transporter permease [Treponema sp.]
MTEKLTGGDRIFIVFIYVITGFLALICLYPMIHVFFASISDPLKLMVHTGVLLKPQGISLKGYQIVFSNRNIYTGYFNTIYYVIIGTLVNMLCSSLGAYALSRPNYMFKRTITVGIVFTMYFSGGLIPSYLLVRALGLYNSRLAIVLPGAIATWNLIVMKTSFQAIPNSLGESAKIDGANDLVILFRIFLPVAKATMAVMALFYAVGHWNSWFNAMIYIQDRGKYPLSLFLREILIANSVSGNVNPDANVFFLDEIIKYATIIISTVPILVAYPFAQRYFMTGVMLGSLKE